MRINRLIGAGLLSGIFSLTVSSCQEQQLKEIPRDSIDFNISSKSSLLIYKTSKCLRDTSYQLYGYDTVEITKDFYNNIPEYIKFLDEKAKEKTPKIKNGKQLITKMLPKTGGGWIIIPVNKDNLVPQYTEQKARVPSYKIFTRNGDDLYIPVEYYGKENK